MTLYIINTYYPQENGSSEKPRVSALLDRTPAMDVEEFNCLVEELFTQKNCNFDEVLEELVKNQGFTLPSYETLEFDVEGLSPYQAHLKAGSLDK